MEIGCQHGAHLPAVRPAGKWHVDLAGDREDRAKQKCRRACTEAARNLTQNQFSQSSPWLPIMASGQYHNCLRSDESAVRRRCAVDELLMNNPGIACCNRRSRTLNRNQGAGNLLVIITIVAHGANDLLGDPADLRPFAMM